jgi:hypothetical protein
MAWLYGDGPDWQPQRNDCVTFRYDGPDMKPDRLGQTQMESRGNRPTHVKYPCQRTEGS